MSNNQTKAKLFFSNEIAGAILSSRCSQDASLVQQIKQDAQSAIFSAYNFDVGDVTVNAVENTDNQIALVLPYYGGVKEVSAKAIGEDEAEQISAGGEIFIFCIITAVAATASVAATSTIGATAHHLTK